MVGFDDAAQDVAVGRCSGFGHVHDGPLLFVGAARVGVACAMVGAVGVVCRGVPARSFGGVGVCCFLD